MFKNSKILAVNANPVEYHKNVVERGDPAFVMSSSSLRAFASCPSRWLAGYELPDSEAKNYGSLLDCRLLTPEQFNERYIIQPETYVSESKRKGSEPETKPWNNNSNFCKDWTERQLSTGLEIVKPKMLDKIDAAIKIFRGDEILCSFVDCCEKQVWVSSEWHDKSGVVIPFRTLIDLVPKTSSEFATCLGDLKSTQSAALGPFSSWCFKAGYHIQASIFMDVFNSIKNQQRSVFCLLLQEQFPPFQIGRRMMRDTEAGQQPEDSNILSLGRVQYRRMLEKYAWCLSNKKWPSYDDSDVSSSGWTPIYAEPYMTNKVLFDTQFNTPTEEPEPDAEENADVTP